MLPSTVSGSQPAAQQSAGAPPPPPPPNPSVLDFALRGVPALAAAAKGACPRCGKRKLLFCPECALPTPAGAGVPPLPAVRLPLRLHILRGKEEPASKSTATHAAVLAPEDTTIFRLPAFPAYADPSRVLLLFPSPSSVSVRDLPDLCAFDTVLLVDTTWQKAGTVLLMPEVIGSPFAHVAISDYRTLFWRYQPIGPHCVSTVEAAYLLLREFDVESRRRAVRAAGAAALHDTDAAAVAASAAASVAPWDPGNTLYDGRFDGLLTLFLDNYARIQREYTEGRAAEEGRTFTAKHRPGYIVGPPPLQRPRLPEAVAAAEPAPAGGDDVDAGDGDDGGDGGGNGGGDGDGGDDDGDDVGGGLGEERVDNNSRKRRRARIRGLWAVRSDVMTASAAALSRERVDRLVANTGTLQRLAQHGGDGARAAHAAPAAAAAVASRGDGAVAAADAPAVVTPAAADTEALVYAHVLKNQQQAYGARGGVGVAAARMTAAVAAAAAATVPAEASHALRASAAPD